MLTYHYFKQFLNKLAEMVWIVLIAQWLKGTNYKQGPGMQADGLYGHMFRHINLGICGVTFVGRYLSIETQ
jgi:hypothetical protein